MQTVTFRSFIAKKEEYNHKETEEQLDQITQALPKTGCSSVLRNLEFFLLHLLQSSCAKKSAVDHGFEPRTYQAKDFKIGICYFSIQQV